MARRCVAHLFLFCYPLIKISLTNGKRRRQRATTALLIANPQKFYEKSLNFNSHILRTLNEHFQWPHAHPDTE